MIDGGTVVLTLATLGLLVYGAYSIVQPVVNLIQGSRLELWAELGSIGFGLLLGLSAAFVRVRIPGGILLALGSMLGLQALAVHSAAHYNTGVPLQVMRAAVAVLLLVLAQGGSQIPEPEERQPNRSGGGQHVRE
jgi:hypothetical protein